jgi:hypothetical protein
MKLTGLVLGAGIMLAPVAAHARAWIVEDNGSATCKTLPADGIVSPADFLNQVRNQGIVPDVDQENGPDGTLASVTISFTDPTSGPVHLSFFTSMAACQAQLKADIADGQVTDPNALN